MTRRSPSLRREIVLWYSVVLVLALGLFGVASYLLLRQALERAETASLRQTAQTIEQLTIPASIPRTALSEEFVVMESPTGEKLDALRRRIRLITGQGVEVVVTRSDDVRRHVLDSFLTIVLLLIPVTAVAAALGGRALVQRLLGPLQRLVDTTGQIGIGDMSRRVAEPDRPAELQELARSFNDMLTRLERAVQALSRFTADASHELRTPLTSIKGTVQVALARPREKEELEETLGEVLEETEWMLHLVDGLLTLARGDEGNGRLQRREVDVVELLADVAEVGSALALDKPVEVRLDAVPGLRVSGSPAQLRQVFLNLVSNAVKFTEQGLVEIRAVEVEGPAVAEEGSSPEGESAPPPRWVEVRVRDTGPGIDPEDLPRVFDRFYRGDAARTRSGGTGLGLAIARLLVEQHGGEVSVESEVGRGSDFVVRLPAADTAVEVVAPAGAPEEGA